MSTETISGPYWVREAIGGYYHVCGRNAAIVRIYSPTQEALALADCKRLQLGFKASEKRLKDAAPDLLAALKDCLEQMHHPVRDRAYDIAEKARAAIAKATAAS